MRISDWCSDVCSSDLVLHRLAHFQKGLYGQEPVVADVDVAADGQRAARERPAAEREGALLDRLDRQMRLQPAPEGDAFQQGAAPVQPRQAEAEGRVHVEVTVDRKSVVVGKSVSVRGGGG